MVGSSPRRRGFFLNNSNNNFQNSKAAFFRALASGCGAQHCLYVKTVHFGSGQVIEFQGVLPFCFSYFSIIFHVV